MCVHVPTFALVFFFLSHSQKHIFEPIGLAQNSFSFTLRPDLAERHLPCTFRHPATRVLSPLPAGVPILALDPAKVTDHWGGMGLHGTLREYLNVIQAILVQKDSKLLSEKSWDLLWKPTLKEGDQPLEELAIFRPRPIGTGDVQLVFLSDGRTHADSLTFCFSGLQGWRRRSLP